VLVAVLANESAPPHETLSCVLKPSTCAPSSLFLLLYHYYDFTATVTCPLPKSSSLLPSLFRSSLSQSVHTSYFAVNSIYPFVILPRSSASSASSSSSSSSSSYSPCPSPPSPPPLQTTACSYFCSLPTSNPTIPLAKHQRDHCIFPLRLSNLSAHICRFAQRRTQPTPAPTLLGPCCLTRTRQGKKT